MNLFDMIFLTDFSGYMDVSLAIYFLTFRFSIFPWGLKQILLEKDNVYGSTLIL